MRISICDKQSYKITSREYTDEGFLRVPGRVARTGTQDYLAGELGLPGDPNRIVKVYRPAEEVFSKDSLASYSGVDITIEHPSSFVDSETYSSISKGVVLNAVQDGDFVLPSLIIKSKDAIEAVESGKVQLSAGYSAIYDKAPDGKPYEYIQRNIRINHVALVSNARAGAQARIFDNKPEVVKMTKIVLDSGHSVEIEDGAIAALISDSQDRLVKRATDAEAKACKAEADADVKKEKLKESEDSLKKATDSGVILAKVQEILTVTDSAKRIAGSDFECESVDAMEIKRAALTKSNDSIAWADKEDAYVSARFDVADEDMKAKEKEKAEGEEEEEAGKKATDSQRKMLAQDGAKSPLLTTDAKHEKRAFIDSQSWKVSTGQMTKDALNALATERFGG